MKKTIVITGSSGVIGTILVKHLATNYSLVLIDKNTCDLRNVISSKQAIPQNTDVLIHLAWKDAPMYKNGTFDADNILMTLNMLEIAKQKNIKRVILASSVHANEYRTNFIKSMPIFRDLGDPSVSMRMEGNPPEPKNVASESSPTSIYGATKLYFEALGRYYATHHNLEVIALRLGGVNKDNSPYAKDESDYDKIFLSHKDLIRTIKHYIDKKNIQNNYECVYALSKKSTTPQSSTKSL